MTDARTEVLARVREALGVPASDAPTTTGSRPGTPASGGLRTMADDDAASRTPDVAREYRTAGEHGVGSAEVLELLVDRLVDYKAVVHEVAADEVAATVARLLAELPGTAGATGATAAALDAGAPSRSEGASVVVPHGLDTGWLAAVPAGTRVVTDAPGHALSSSDLDGIGAVVTAARVAIAETGTIVLDGEPDQGRRAVSLVPDVHVCVVRADQVVQTVPEAVRLLGAHPQRPLTWISGPSATSDIELNRVEGVHGPRTLHVVLAG